MNGTRAQQVQPISTFEVSDAYQCIFLPLQTPQTPVFAQCCRRRRSGFLRLAAASGCGGNWCSRQRSALRRCSSRGLLSLELLLEVAQLALQLADASLRFLVCLDRYLLSQAVNQVLRKCLDRKDFGL